MAKDKELADHERAHSGKPGAKVRHGADATGKVSYPKDSMGIDIVPPSEETKKELAAERKERRSPTRGFNT